MTPLGAAAIGVLLAGCAASPSTTPLASDAIPSTPRATGVDASPTAQDASPTARAETAADLLECDGPVSSVGGRADDFGPDTGGDTPDEAFEAFIAGDLFRTPVSGYRSLGEVAPDRSVYAFDRDGEIKIVIVVSRRFGEMVGAPYTVEEIRMCETAEFGAADFGEAHRTWVHEVTGDILTDIPGPSHCEWQSARMLHVEEDGQLVKQYLRDPQGVFDVGRLLETYAEGVDLPPDATDSGYRSTEGFELWFTASDRAAYVVTPDGVERWPRAEEPIGCA
jgi:hypothetical protein